MSIAMKQTTRQLYDSFFETNKELMPCSDSIIATYDKIIIAIKNDKKILICGNGGSSADADHIVGELMNRFLVKRTVPDHFKGLLRKNMPADQADSISSRLQQSIMAISLSAQPALTTAIANDLGADLVFAQQVYGYGRSGDVLIGLSTSGNSQNVLNAIYVAKAIGLTTIGFTGEHGGAMNSLCDVTIRVPSSTTFRIQEYHLPVYHLLCAMLENEMFA